MNNIEDVDLAIEKAIEELSRICENPRSSFRMSIPARRDYDSDLIIGNGLFSAKAEISRLRDKLAIKEEIL